MRSWDGRDRPECPEDVCVTCSDEARLLRVVRSLPGDMALAAADGSAEEPEEISVALVVAPAGTTVLVHAGEAIAAVPDAVPGDTRTGEVDG
ncbi:hydrogenase assembly protein HupF [Streptomyces minutiscleroticus]|uniref:Uncharacterized protein n=1 Tax=Streptomyces minutiscleroticus TaxID=68238 RepID=A0A918KSH8_9ACTN|nr:hydrogenase assembly protein HupF [Streptomyces minutiscleroticus]GGX71677.1 hypothetical protein GCM10010358_27470 [Streptomyces minutiscleroticus]